MGADAADAAAAGAEVEAVSEAAAASERGAGGVMVHSRSTAFGFRGVPQSSVTLPA